MKLDKIELIDLGILIDDTLIICDIHMGLDEAMNKQGVLIPRHHFKDVMQKMENILEKVNVKRIVINGDIKHEFGTISETEWRHTLRFLDLLLKNCDEIVLIKGNHDTVIGPIAEKRNVSVKESYVIGDILVIHGDKIPDKKMLKDVNMIIIGHEHPAISISDFVRSEKIKCYLKGKFEGKELIVQPSLNQISEGTDILKEKLLSPFLKNIDNFEVYAVSDTILNFGKVNDLRNKFNRS